MWKQKLIILSFLCVFLELSFCAVSSLPDSRDVVKTIRESFSCRKNNPALSVAIVKDGSIIYANGFGVQSLVTKKPVTKDTLFGIASLTKGFTSALLAKLTDKSREYSLNTRVSEFYGNSPVFDGYFRSKFATIKDLLSHRMGIPMHNFIRFDSKLTRRNLIRRLKVLRPRGRFRDSFYYSNIMYGQAARLAEKIGKKKYEELIRDELFKGIGMTSSDFFTTANESLIELAQGYLDVYGELRPVPFELSKKWSDLCGANCILSNAEDMGKWMMFHLRHGRNENGRRVMSNDALEDTHRPENVLAQSSLSKYYSKPNVPETFSQTGYALGWRTGHYRGYKMLTHTGSSWGYKNMITMFPDMDLGIYTALTGDDDDFLYRYSLHQYLADMYLGETPWLNATTICSFPEPWFPAKPMRTKPNISKEIQPQRNLDDYLGVYENPAYGQIEMFILDEENSTNKLIAEFGYVDLILYPKKQRDEFFFETDGIASMLINFGTVQFKSSNGTIDKMRIPTFEPKDPPIFKKIYKSQTATKTQVDQSKPPSITVRTEVTQVKPQSPVEKTTESVPLSDKSPESTTRSKDANTKPTDVSTSKPKVTASEKTPDDLLVEKNPTDPLSDPDITNSTPKNAVEKSPDTLTESQDVPSVETSIKETITNTNSNKTDEPVSTETKPITESPKQKAKTTEMPNSGSTEKPVVESGTLKSETTLMQTTVPPKTGKTEGNPTTSA